METEIRNESYYKELVNFSLLAGLVLMASRAETNRVEDTVSRILKTSGLPITEAFVLPTGITVTLSDNKDMTICVNKRTAPGEVNIRKIDEVNQVSRDFCSGVKNLEESYAKLKEISEEKGSPLWLKLIGTSLASGGFSIVFGGSVLDGIAALVIGFILGICLHYIKKLLQKDFLTIALCSFIVAFFGVLVSWLAIKVNISISPQYIISGCLMPLVPGVAITNAVRDVLSGDFLSACARAVEAVMVASAIAIGVSGGLYISELIGLSDAELGFVMEISRGSLVADVIYGAISIVIAIIGFIYVMEIPRKYIIQCCATGCVAWVCFILFDYAKIDMVWATFLATLLAELVSYVFARIYKAPVITFLIAGIIPLVPGIYIYRAAYYFVTKSPLSSSALTDTIKLAAVIALGILVMGTILQVISRGIRKLSKKE